MGSQSIWSTREPSPAADRKKAHRLSKNEIDPETLHDFLSETVDLLEQLEGELIMLESTPQDIPLINRIFRTLHTIKGSASFLALTNLVVVAHSIEGVLNAARTGQIMLTKPEIDLMLAAVDTIKAQYRELASGLTNITPANPDLMIKLGKLSRGTEQQYESVSLNFHSLEASPPPPHDLHPQTIRVDLARLESLMDLVNELTLENSRIGAISEDIARALPDNEIRQRIEHATSSLDRVTADLHHTLMRTRMQPLNRICARYPRLIRDLGSKSGKQIHLEIIGGETEIEKTILDGLCDPIMHLLRNCVDHGIETAKERLKKGKAQTGSIQIKAQCDHQILTIRVIDDGRGLCKDTIGRKAIDLGLLSPQQLAKLNNKEIFRYIFEPGFSTAEHITEGSGRGVGMDVVREEIEHQLHGSVQIDSTIGQGTTVSITIPIEAVDATAV